MTIERCNNTIRFNFDTKNHGLTNEFQYIDKKIKELSKEYNVYLTDSQIGDNKYSLIFTLIRK